MKTITGTITHLPLATGTYGIIDRRQIVNGNAESKQSETNVANK